MVAAELVFRHRGKCPELARVAMKRVLLTCSLIAVLLLVLVLWNFAARRRAGSAGPGDSAHDASATQRFDKGEPTGEVDRDPAKLELSVRTQPTSDELSSRVAAQNPTRLPGMLRWPDGRPCVGAVVSLTALVQDLPGDSSWWYEVPWTEVRARTTWAISDERGNFEFSEIPLQSAQVTSALWVTHEDAFAKVEIIPARGGTAIDSIDIALEPSPKWFVHVVDESGADASAAELRQFGIRGRDRVGTGSQLDLAHRMFFRNWSTGSDGRIAVAPIRGTLGFVAELGERRSRPWFGSHNAAEEILITLHGPISFSGVVRGCAPNSKSEPMNVVCASVRGTSAAQLGSARVRSDGMFGPVDLPFPPTDLFDVYLEGGGCQAVHLRTPVPSPGERLWVEIESDRGVDFPVEVVDAQRRPVLGAQVAINWDHEGAVARVNGRTDDNGRFVARGCRPGIIRLATSASGFRSEYETLSIPTAIDSSYVVELEPGASLSVKVVHDGKPVKSFDLIYEGVQPPSAMGRTTVVDSVDGTCLIEDAPIGVMNIVAISEESPRSETITLETKAETANHVLIEMPPQIVGRGRVLDAQSRQPIPGSWVQIFSNQGGLMLLPWGPRHSTDVDGRFEIRGFAPGETCCKVGAPGYSEGFGLATGEIGRGAEIGEIVLTRQQTLTVRLVGTDGVDPSRFYGFSQGTITLPRRNFDAQGLARWDDVDCGEVMLQLTDDVQYVDALVRLAAGSSWDFEVPVGGPGSLLVEVERADNSEQVAWYARATPALPGFQRVVMDRIPDASGRVEFRGLPKGPVMLELLASGTSRCVAMERVIIGAEDQIVRVRLDAKKLHVRVVDRGGLPVVGAEVMLLERPSRGGWSSRETTDANGWTRWSSLSLDRVDVHLYHASIGSRADLSVALDRDVNEVEFVLEADARVRVRAMDGAQMLSGVPVEIGDSSGVYDYGVFAGDGNGISESRAVHEGRYLVRVRTPSIWPFEGHFSAREDEGYDVLQLRRRGGLELVVFDANGARVANAVVLLASNELGSSVAHWLASGLCTASSSSLSTNDQGVLVIDGIPRGDYTWTCGSASGITTVEPLKRRTVELRLP